MEDTCDCLEPGDDASCPHMKEPKAGVAIFVKSKVRSGREEWRESYLFGGHFESIGASLNYLKFLEEKNTEFIVQIGFVGWGR